MAFWPEHPKSWDQNQKFATLSETTSIPARFIWEPPAVNVLSRIRVQHLSAPLSYLHKIWRDHHLSFLFLYTFIGELRTDTNVSFQITEKKNTLEVTDIVQ